MSRANRSDALKIGIARAPARAMLKATGLTDDDLAKPLVGVVSTWTDVMPCTQHLRRLAARVREGVRAAGGTPVEFGVIAACDGVAQGHVGMHYIQLQVVVPRHHAVPRIGDAYERPLEVIVGVTHRLVQRSLDRTFRPGEDSLAAQIHVHVPFVHGWSAHWPGLFMQGGVWQIGQTLHRYLVDSTSTLWGFQRDDSFHFLQTVPLPSKTSVSCLVRKYEQGGHPRLSLRNR